MLVAGVDLPVSSVAQLALCLSRTGENDIAMRVGLAVDTQRESLGFDPVERTRILRTLEDCPTALLPLKDALTVSA